MIFFIRKLATGYIVPLFLKFQKHRSTKIVCRESKCKHLNQSINQLVTPSILSAKSQTRTDNMVSDGMIDRTDDSS